MLAASLCKLRVSVLNTRVSFLSLEKTEALVFNTEIQRQKEFHRVVTKMPMIMQSKKGVILFPDSIRCSKFLSTTHLELLGNLQTLPFIDPTFTDDRLKNIVQYYSINPTEMEKELHIYYAAELLNAGRIDDAWQILLSGENI